MNQKKKKGVKDFKDIKITMPVFTQLLFTEGVFIFAIVSLFEPVFLSVFYILVGITLFIMAFNSYIYYKKKYFSAASVFLSIIYVILGLYFIISTIIKLFK